MTLRKLTLPALLLATASASQAFTAAVDTLQFGDTIENANSGDFFYDFESASFVDTRDESDFIISNRGGVFSIASSPQNFEDFDNQPEFLYSVVVAQVSDELVFSEDRPDPEPAAVQPFSAGDSISPNAFINFLGNISTDFDSETGGSNLFGTRGFTFPAFITEEEGLAGGFAEGERGFIGLVRESIPQFEPGQIGLLPVEVTFGELEVEIGSLTPISGQTAAPNSGITFGATPVPEPSSALILLLCGISSIGFRNRR